MKKMIAVFAVLFCCAALWGAEIKAGTPSHSVKTFFVSMSKADFAAAKKLVADKTLAGMIEFVEKTAKEDPSLIKEAAAEFAAAAKLEIISEKITGDKAEVVIKYKEKGKTEKITVELQKIGSIWKLVGER